MTGPLLLERVQGVWEAEADLEASVKEGLRVPHSIATLFEAGRILEIRD